MQLRYALLILVALVPLSVSAALTRNLSRGSVGEDVRELQQLLNRDTRTRVAATGLGSPGQETTYFGPATESAVKRYQSLNAAVVLHPIGLSSGNGFVGPLTRASLNNESPTVSGSEEIVEESGIVIHSVTPTSGPAGTRVTLTGSGFDDRNGVRASFAFLQNVPSTRNGTEITFVVKSPFPDDLELPSFFAKQVPSLPYGFYIENGDRVSNAVEFTLLFE